MKIDLLHNKIVAETMTDAFKSSVESSLIPLLYNIYSEDELLGIQMYEDYIADNFSKGGYWYYPLTVVTDNGYGTIWVKWAVDEDCFEDGIPYAYVGDGEIEFSLADDTPDEFAEALLGRALYCEDGIIKVGVKSSASPIKLSGKYSQTFLDELARQITPAIESATSTVGIADSSIELLFNFISGTYMDHISDNVTYRRLTMIDGASAPRDFWVKWTRLDGAVAYSVSDNVWGDNIVFEIGEDVSGKILEKEFRYLLSSVGAKYHSAMSRSGVTAWRDLIKRAIKHGELVKLEKEIELLPETLALSDQLAAALGMSGKSHVSESVEDTESFAEADLGGDDEFARAMRKAREIAMGDTDYEAAPEPEWVEITEEADEINEPLAEAEKIPEDEVIEVVADIPEDEVTEEVEDILEDEAVEEDIEYETKKTVEFTEEMTEELIAELEEVLEKMDEEVEEQVRENDEIDEILDELFGEVNAEEEPDAEDEEADLELDEVTRMALEALAFAKETDEPVAEESVKEISFDIEIPDFTSDEPVVDEALEAEAEIEIISEPVEAAELVEKISLDIEAADFASDEPATVLETEPVAEEIPTEIPSDLYDEVPYIDEESIRREIETKIRLEYESRARIRAEEEVAILRREQERLRLEKEALIAEAAREKEALRLEYEKLKEQTMRDAAAAKARDAVRRVEEERLRAEIEARLRHEAKERERLAEAARMAIEEQRRLEEEAIRSQRILEEEERARLEAEYRAAETARLEEMRKSELDKVLREEEERRRALRETMPEMGNGSYNYTNRTVRLMFRKSVDPNITHRIQGIMKAAVEYYGKEKMYIKVRASVPDTQTVLLEFIHIPLEEMELLGNIIKILGNSGLGIARAKIE